MEMSAFPDIKLRGNGQIGKKVCRQKKGMSGKLADIDVSARYVADMSPTFPTKARAVVRAVARAMARARARARAMVRAVVVAVMAATMAATTAQQSTNLKKHWHRQL